MTAAASLRLATLLAGAATALLLALPAPARADAAACAAKAATDAAKARCAAKPGDLIEARLEEFRPTQPALGFDELAYRLGRFEFGKDAINKRFDDWCESAGLGGAASAQPGAKLSDPASFACKLAKGQETAKTIAPVKTAAIGPGGTLYLTDGHHTFTSFTEAADGGPKLVVRVRVTDNLGDLDEAAFWAEMKKRKLVWLYDPDGKQVAPEQLPKSLGKGNFQNDRYRSVLYFTRDVAYEELEDVAFQEFYFGVWMQKNPALKLTDERMSTHAAYVALVREVATTMAALPDDAVVAEGMTAKQLGRISPMNEKELAKVSVPYEEAKPGKIAYVFKYREAHK